MTNAPSPDSSREMFEEINALIGAVAKALEIGEPQVVAAIEEGALTMELLTDDQGANYLRVEHDGKAADIRQGVFLKRE